MDPDETRRGPNGVRVLEVASACHDGCHPRHAASGEPRALCETGRVRAVVLNSFAGLDALELSEVADPSRGAGEELVAIRAASLGPWDHGAAAGAFAVAGGSTDFPQVQGWDFAGETTAGRRVLGFVAQPWMGVGAFAERIAVPSTILAPLPEDLSFVEGSTLPVCTLTARLLVDAAAVKEGDLVLVSGAAGMVGGFAAQLASGRGARVVAAVRDSDADEARRLGAETILNTGADLETAVRGAWEDGVDACVDTIGLGAAALVCVRDGGAFVTTAPTAVPGAARGIAPEAVQVQPDAAAAAELAQRAASGELTVRVAETFPLERFHEAYISLERGSLHGKIVLTL
jgi:NADPH2:quinone reductase